MGSKSIKVAIYSGSYPDTTFISLLIDELSKRKEVEPYIFGKRKKKFNRAKKSGITFCLIPNNKVIKLFYLIKYLIILIVRNQNLAKALFFISRQQHPNSLKARMHSLARIIPFAIYKPDIIHIQWILHYSFFEPYLDKLNLKVIISLRGYQLSISSFIDENCREITIRALNRAHAIHSISNDLTEQALLLCPTCNAKIVKIPPAINIALFKARIPLVKLRKKIRLISVCRLTWKKGLTYGIRALKLLINEGFDIEYKIIGNGAQREELLFLIEELGLNKHVDLMGHLTQLDLKEILVESDVFLLPSVQEGFSNAVLEAQAIGVPCLVSDAEGLSENISNGVTGFVFKKRSPISIVNAFKKWNFLTEDEKKRMQLACQNRVRAKFPLQKQIDAFESLYKDVATK